MRIIPLIYALLICSLAEAQISTYQLSLKDSNAAILYYNGPNRIRISGVKGSDQVTLRNSFANYRSGNIHSFYILTPASSDTLRIRRGKKIIFTKVFEVKRLPDLAARMGNIKDSFATVKEILAYPKMRIYFGNDTLYNGEWFQLLTFVTISKNHEGDEQILSSNGNYLSQEQRRLIAMLRKGDKILFDEIRATCSDCVARILDPITITIR